MTLHLIKVSAGSKAVRDLELWQASQMARGGSDGPWHVTRMFPKRAEEILPGGSLYWTIGGVFAVRQRITGLDRVRVEDGTERCRIGLHRDLVPVRPVPRRAFQGWRYLTAEDAPEDLLDGERPAGDDSQQLHRTLSELGLL